MTRSAKRESPLVQQALDHIHAHFREPLDNKTIAQALGYHPYYLNRLFSTHVGTQLHEYLMDLRISEAKRLLLESDLPVWQIGETVGFHNRTYFSSCFLKREGIQPSRYRDTYRQTNSVPYNSVRCCQLSNNRFIS